MPLENLSNRVIENDGSTVENLSPWKSTTLKKNLIILKVKIIEQKDKVPLKKLIESLSKDWK